MKRIKITNGNRLKNLIIAVLTAVLYFRAITASGSTLVAIIIGTVMFFGCVLFALHDFDNWLEGKEGAESDV